MKVVAEQDVLIFTSEGAIDALKLGMMCARLDFKDLYEENDGEIRATFKVDEIVNNIANSHHIEL